ncbi:MAG: primosomal protein N' [Bacteroidetes bacterium]|nr:primosomal protein N' [Bacteroidota bacterium]
MSTAFLYADVLVPAALPVTYTWSVPDSFQRIIQVGSRVEVNLGKKKRYTGIVVRLMDKNHSNFYLKPILQVLDTKPLVTPLQIVLWNWIAQYYLCTEGEVMAAALPAHFRLNSDTTLIYNAEASENFSQLNDDEYLVAEALFLQKKLQVDQVQTLLGKKNIAPIVQRLLQKNICELAESLTEKYKPKLAAFVTLSPPYSNPSKWEELLASLKQAPRQQELVQALLEQDPNKLAINAKELLLIAKASPATLKSLVDRGILTLEKRIVDRITVPEPHINLDFTLSLPQQRAFAAVKKEFETKSTVLLHGVTSSGKTNIYVELIAAALRKGQQVLFLLPEIALTTQIIRRLQHHFGGHVGVYHSKFSPNERVEIWHGVAANKTNVILGTRSAIFLPFANLGLIICDEEHDYSYKQQDPAPRYHARDTALYLASLFQAKTVLGSATPSLESYYHATSNKYGLVSLQTRFGDVAMPAVQLVNMNAIRSQAKSISWISPLLEKRIRKALQHQRQVILFQNRRGYTPYQVCKSCGWVPQCLHCAVSLTYHKQDQLLCCHYCGTRYQQVTRCEGCGQNKFLARSFGTEQVEEQLATLFPTARVARLDVDSVKGKGAHDRLINKFELGQIDILVGTQMVVKGIDVEKVDVVGILDADGLLRHADFRVNERAFQLMEQVSGRAGRRDAIGEVLIQTTNPGHPLFEQVLTHNYTQVYEKELAKREEFFYPPFSRMIQLSIRHTSATVAANAATFLAQQLGMKYQRYLLGPSPALIERVRNQYRFELLLKLPRKKQLLEQCRLDIRVFLKALQQKSSFKQVVIVSDVDPY